MFGCWLLAELKAGGDSGGTGGGCDKEFIVESVFRTGQTRTRREIEKVRGEWALVCMTHNILKFHKMCYRAHSSSGISRLLRRSAGGDPHRATMSVPRPYSPKSRARY